MELERIYSFSKDLTKVLGENVKVENTDEYQDSAILTEILLPQSALVIPRENGSEGVIHRRGVLIFSNFSKMVTLDRDDNLKSSVREKVEFLLKKYGFIVIPYYFTNVPYPKDHPNTWGERFFNWK